MCTGVQHFWKQKRAYLIPFAEVTGSCDVGAGNRTWVLAFSLNLGAIPAALRQSSSLLRPQHLHGLACGLIACPSAWVMCFGVPVL